MKSPLRNCFELTKENSKNECITELKIQFIKKSLSKATNNTELKAEWEKLRNKKYFEGLSKSQKIEILEFKDRFKQFFTN